MQIKLPFDSSKPISGEATVELDRALNDVFSFIGMGFFENYPKWAVEVIEFEPLDGFEVFVGAKARQKRRDNGYEVESIFQITDFTPNTELVLKGINEPYKQSYMMMSEQGRQKTSLTFRFELLEIEVFMRPFQKLIRTAIEDGAENTVENIRLLMA
jgi:hypothetical protein